VSYVLDASVAIRWLIRQEVHPHAEAVLERIVSEPENFAVPELFSFEVFSVLARVHPDPGHAFREVILPLLASGVLRYPMTPALAEGALPFTGRGLSGNDACYAALALELDAVWLTFDRKAHGLLADDRLSRNLWDSVPPGW